jgi:cellulose 1,4-beta-cellobiosidase
VGRSAVSGGPYTTIAGVGGATSYTDTGLINGLTYYYVVVASNSGGASPNSSQASGTPNGPPAAPTGMGATTAKGKVTLKWTQSASPGVTQNRIYRSTSGGAYVLLATIGATTSYGDMAVKSGVTYTYVVTALAGGKESPSSNQASAVPK